MRIVRIAVLQVLLFGLVWAETGWQNVELSQVRAAFPGAPARQQSSQSTLVGSVVIVNCAFQGEGYRLTLNSAQLPSAVFLVQGRDAIYDAASEEILKENPGAEKVDKKSMVSLGRPACQLDFRAPSGLQGRARFVLISNTLYTAEATWKGENEPASVGRFFDSLTVR